MGASISLQGADGEFFAIDLDKDCVPLCGGLAAECDLSGLNGSEFSSADGRDRQAGAWAGGYRQPEQAHSCAIPHVPDLVRSGLRFSLWQFINSIGDRQGVQTNCHRVGRNRASTLTGARTRLLLF